MRWALIIGAVVLFAYSAWVTYQMREPRGFSPVMDVVPAAPGGVMEMSGPYKILRLDCKRNPASSYREIKDSSGELFIINQARISFNHTSPSEAEVTIQVEVPVLAEPGEATFAFEGSFDCKGRSVRQRSPDYPITILDPEG